jgi:hypothetical protein
MILAVDSGIRGCGVALLRTDQTRELVRAGYVESSVNTHAPLGRQVLAMSKAVSEWTGEHRITRVVLEVMRVYQGSKQEGDPNDLINLSLVGGMIAGLFPDAHFDTYYPHEWKGQMPKSTCHQRMRERLTPEEALRIEIPRRVSLAHNALDAVCIGLKAANRFDKVRIIAR